MGSYLNEVCVNQKYEISDDELGTSIFTIVEIRATNVESSKDYIVAVSFKNENEFFEVALDKVIGNPNYKQVF